jgi:hypothetical protein
MKRSMVIGPSLLVAATLLAMSGACSQHQPGTYEGGGRDMPSAVVGNYGSQPPPPDASVEDNFVPQPDVSVKETGPTFEAGPG